MLLSDITIGIGAIGIVIVALLIWVVRLELKLRRLLGGNAQNIEEGIKTLKDSIGSFEHFRDEVQKYLTLVERRLRGSVRSVETVRFNPFKGDGSGGNQSFASSFLNEEGNGVVISSMYGRERVSIFAKPIKGYASEYELSEEEKEAVEMSKANLKR